MKLKSKLMLFTAAAALSANMAYAAINPQTLADAYIADGYTFVEVKVGPTQTKLEGVKGDRKVEVIYDNASGLPIKTEFEDADDDYVGRTGVEIEDSSTDFEENDDDENDDDEDGDDENDDDEDEDEDDDNDDDENDDDENDDDDNEGDDNDGGNDDEDDESGSEDDGSENDGENDEDGDDKN